MMRFEVLAGRIVIGHSDLELGDAPMGVAGGLFHPMPEYAAVREACVAARELPQSHIDLSARLIGGEVLPAQGGVQVLDYSDELGAEGLQVHVCGIPYPLYAELFPQHVSAYEKNPGDEG